MNQYFEKESWKIIAQSDLPYLPTPQDIIEKSFMFVDSNQHLKATRKLIDLGSGDGRVIIHASEKYGMDTTGIEINRELIESTTKKINEKGLGSICRVIENDLYNYPVSEFDLIFCFVLPTNHKYFRHVVENIRKNSIIISIRWPLDDYESLITKISMIENPDGYSVFFYKRN